MGQFPIWAQPASHLALASASSLSSCPLSTRYALCASLPWALSGPLPLATRAAKTTVGPRHFHHGFERVITDHTRIMEDPSALDVALPLPILAILGARNYRDRTPSGIIGIIVIFAHPLNNRLPWLIFLSLGLPLPRVSVYCHQQGSFLPPPQAPVTTLHIHTL